MTKDQVCEILEQIAQLLELKGENGFKVRAYQSGARALEVHGGDFGAMVAEGRLEEIDGVGKALATKITELVTTGKLDYFEKLRAEFPAGIFELFLLQGLGAKKIKALYEHLAVGSIADLEAACTAGKVAGLAGFGEKTQSKLLEAIGQRKTHADQVLRGDVTPLAEELADILRGHPNVTRLSIAGSYRRAKEVVRDLDIIVSSRKPDAVMDAFVQLPEVDSVIGRGPTKSSVVLKGGLQCDLRVVEDAEFPFALNYFTGSKEHNVVMRGRALDRGWTLNEYRLAPFENSKRAEAEPIPDIADERDLYRALGLEYVPPELRENTGEIEAAAENSLPRLLELTNLRGTFHNHTTASDGRNTLIEMAEAADDLGLEYLGIADHSKSNVLANGLSEERLLAQVEEIRKYNEGGHRDIHVYAGVECDILRDGSLDYEDSILAQLDYVVASVHQVFTLPEEEMTQRIIRAMENPYVTMIGHVTGRLLLSRPPYALNLPKIIDAAAATGTWIELNANPHRLDMDWRWWRSAKEKGVKCVINPDAHRASRLQDLHFGVGIARKGWLTREDVMNCLPLDRIEEAMRAKRGGA